MKISSAKQLQQEVDQLIEKMNDPVINRDASKMKELTEKHSKKKSLLDLVSRLETVTQEKNDTQELLDSGDSEIAVLATDDLSKLKKERKEIKNKISELLLPRDPRDSRDIILEIRAGAGGEEAALFAAELFRSYTRYAERNNWNVHTLGTSQGEQGGLKEVVAEISGNKIFGTLKYERGVHRVQRVPETEKQGRIHTSTVTVAILPQAKEIDLEIKNEDLRIDTYRASGAGGQHVNKTSSAIRITHIPTNTVVAVQDERSQHKNKEKAMSVMRSRLLEAREEEKHNKAANERRQQVGTGDRSEKIRTYNFPQDRITDHRIKKSWSNIPATMDGAWEEIFSSLQKAEREMLIKQQK